MKCIYTRLLSDEELRPHLERGDSVAFKGLGREWEEIERQVERLGYGETYAVSRASNPNAPGHSTAARLSPLHQPQQEP